MNKVIYYKEGFIKDLIEKLTEDLPYFPSKFITEINTLLVAEMLARYDKLNQQTSLSTKEQKELYIIKNFIRKENTRVIEHGSLEDRINRYLDENLPQ